MKERITQRGERHGLINVLTNSVKFDDFKNMDPMIKEKCKKEKEDDSKIVKARYINYYGDHERLTKPYCRWSGDQIQIWHLIPNEVYELPKGFVKEVNSSKGLLRRSEVVDANGVPTPKDGGFKKQHELVPISF